MKGYDRIGTDYKYCYKLSIERLQRKKYSYLWMK